jgi:hypothetical protein
LRLRDAMSSTVLKNLDNKVIKTIKYSEKNYFIIGFGQWHAVWHRLFSIEIYIELKNTVMLVLESKLLRSRIEMYCSCSQTILL